MSTIFAETSKYKLRKNSAKNRIFYSSKFSAKSWQNPATVADPGFPRGGGANHKGGAPTYYLAKFSRKLHENEEILGQRGGASLAPPLRSATVPGLIFYGLRPLNVNAGWVLP